MHRTSLTRRAVIGGALTGVLMGVLVAPAIAVTAPLPPGQPTTASRSAELGITWQTSATATGYLVELSEWPVLAFAPAASGSCAGVVVATQSSTQTCSLTGLTNGRAYVVRIIALGDTPSEPSVASLPSVPATTPDPPVNLRVDPVWRGLTIRWDPPGSNGGAPLTGYVVEVSAGDRSHFARVPLTECSGRALARRCDVHGLAPGSRYFVRVAATNRRGTGDASDVVGGVPLAPGDVVLGFGGDVHFTGASAGQGRAGGLPTLPRIFAGVDITMVNLETALATGSSAPVNKEFTFKASPSVLQTLADAGVDVVTMANNHGVDYGSEGLRTTLAARAHSPTPIVGVGRTTSDAIRPFTTSVKGTSFAFFGIVGLDLAQEENSQVARTWPATATTPGLAVWRNHREQILAAVREWSTKVDVVVVYAHWGREMATCSNQAQRNAAADLVRAGADVIVGAHPHVLQGAGWRGRAVVAFSLGNFAWYAYPGRPSAALIVHVHRARVTDYEWRPTTYTGSGQPVLVSASDARYTRGLIDERSSATCTGLSPQARLMALTSHRCGNPLTALEQSVPEFE